MMVHSKQACFLKMKTWWFVMEGQSDNPCRNKHEINLSPFTKMQTGMNVNLTVTKPVVDIQVSSNLLQNLLNQFVKTEWNQPYILLPSHSYLKTSAYRVPLYNASTRGDHAQKIQNSGDLKPLTLICYFLKRKKR